MRIKTIAGNSCTAPVQKLVAHINAIEASQSLHELRLNSLLAETYLIALTDTQYILAREKYEYSRQISDVCSATKAQLTAYDYRGGK